MTRRNLTSVTTQRIGRRNGDPWFRKKAYGLLQNPTLAVEKETVGVAHGALPNLAWEANPLKCRAEAGETSKKQNHADLALAGKRNRRLLITKKAER